MRDTSIYTPGSFLMETGSGAVEVERGASSMAAPRSIAAAPGIS